MSTTAQQATEQANSRQAQLEAKAKATVKDYKPKTGKAFDGSRGYVEAQFEIGFELQERYTGILEERAVNREQLRSLYSQGLLTKEEAQEAFMMYPERQETKRASGGNGQQAATPAS